MDRDPWQRLCALLDDDEHLWPSVAEALEGTDPGGAWAALIDGLDDAGALAYLEAGDSGMELTDALVQLPRVFQVQPDLDEVTDTDDLDDALRAADGILAADQLRLVRLDDGDEDAVALVVVPAQAAVPIVDLAASLGHHALLLR